MRTSAGCQGRAAFARYNVRSGPGLDTSSQRPCAVGTRIKGCRMKRLLLAGLALGACRPSGPTEHYGFIARLGRDTVSVENVTRQGNRVTSDEVDRFPRVRQRHTEIELGDNGRIRHLAMDIVTPSEEPKQRTRHVTVDVTKDSVHIIKRDSAGTVRRDFATNGGI